MPFLLQRISGPAGGEEQATSRVEGDLLRIGRGTNADLRFDDVAVALEHASIAGTESGWLLTDRGSVTGTYVNGRPVTEWRLADGEVIDIGPYRLRVQMVGPRAPLELEVRRLAEAPGPEESAAAVPAISAAAAPVRPPLPLPPRVDYVAAYRLRSGLLAKPWLALLLTALAAALPLALAFAGRSTIFQPGPLSRSHAAQPQLVRLGLGCIGCHTPWLGPADERCQACHRRGGTASPAAAHQARQAAVPPCGGCHFEHRGSDRLTLVEDRRCVACHGDLAVLGGGAPAVAAHVHSFAADHPDFAVSLPAGTGGAARRVPLAAAIAQGVDPATVKLNHRLHLRPGLAGLPAGKPRLVCQDCHRPAAGGTGIAPVRYADACAGCHRLTFDKRRPDREAPHDRPERVREFLDAFYSDRRDLSLSVMQQRRDLLRRRLAPGQSLDLGAAATRRIADAEVYLYRTACPECHAVDPDARPLPTVAPTAIPAVWLPHGRFPHQKPAHVAVDCLLCHAGAATSTKTADVLLPGIAACRGCHGEGQPLSGITPVAGPTRCLSCHSYHGGVAVPRAAG